jgi:hypothetical protein
MTCFGIDTFFNYGGELEIDDWRSLHPLKLIKKIDEIMKRRIDLT